MKKLSNLFEAVTSVDVTKYPNLDFPANIVPGCTPASDSINDVLLQDLNTAAGNAKVKASVTTAVSGHNEKTSSGNLSRHPGGLAVDIAMINGKSPTKSLGDTLVAELVKLGYQSVSAENASVPKSILWQVGDHFNHIHVSNTGNAASTSTPTGGSVASSDTINSSGQDDEFTAMAQNISKTSAAPLIAGLTGQEMPQTESISLKELRLIKNIEKIKKLL